MQISVLVATQSGTANRVAEAIERRLTDAGHTVDILFMETLDADVFRRAGVFIICTSTYGAGDVPLSARYFLTDLRLEQPNLSGTIIGIAGLGDSAYTTTFNRGGARFAEILAALNADIVGERMRHDASGDIAPEAAGAAWAGEWIATVQRRLDTAPAEKRARASRENDHEDEKRALEDREGGV